MLVTAARNEEAFIKKTILSVVSQILVPRKWVIIDDGSTDRTAEIVWEYARQHQFIQLVQLDGKHPPDFCAQVHAINAGYETLKHTDYEFIGNLDADISFEPSYFSTLLAAFEADPSLGLAGGFLHEERKGEFRSRRGNRVRSVPHAVQLFRRQCFESIGGYLPLRYGAPDWCAEVQARMNGWRVQSFPHLKVFHHKPTGGGSGHLRYMYRAGLAASSLGSRPLFEFLRCVGRIHEKPFVIGALTRLVGFAVGNCRGERKLVSPQFVDFLRNEQTERLRAFLWGTPEDRKGSHMPSSAR